VDGGSSSGRAAEKQLTDAELVTLSLSGVDQAFGWLIERHTQHLRRLVARRLRDPDDVLDVLQETQLAVWRALDSFDAGRPFEAWLTSIALNKCRDWARHRSVHLGLMMRIRSDASHADASVAERSAESLIMERERLHDLGRALNELARPLREPLLLTTLSELPQAMVARALGLTRKAVEMRVRRARQDLARSMRIDRPAPNPRHGSRAQDARSRASD
jgi:RNA polymerase sigma factor CnrH